MKKSKLFLKLCKYVPDASFQMMIQQYSKISSKVPAVADELWEVMNSNRKFMKKHRREYKIVSLGADCMPRTYSTVYMLKPCRAAGEKGMPFDLARTPPHGLAYTLETDFADYFNDRWSYDHENSRWKNDPATGMYYSHDRDCTPEMLDVLQKRLQGRIDNFHEMLKFPGLVLFLAHKRLEGDIADLERAAAAVRKMRNGLPTKIVVVANDAAEVEQTMENADYHYLKYPGNAPDWFEPESRFSEAGVRYEIKFAKLLRCLLEEQLGI